MLGWAIPERWFAPYAQAAFPDASHVFFEANPISVAQLCANGPWDHVCGYSLGAHLLLAQAAHVAPLAPVSLLAPIFAFPREENLGGRSARTAVRQLARWLKHDPAAALRDFYQRADLDIPLDLAPLDRVDALQWGLERLAHGRVEPPMPSTWNGWCGDQDPLLDAPRLCALDPRIATVAGGHHPRFLMRHVALAGQRAAAKVADATS